MCCYSKYHRINLRFIIPSAISLDLHYRVSDMGKILQFNMVVDHVAHESDQEKHERVCNNERNTLNLNCKLHKQY